MGTIVGSSSYDLGHDGFTLKTSDVADPHHEIREIDSKMVDALLRGARPGVVAELVRDGLRLSQSGLRGIEIAEAVLPNGARKPNAIAPDSDAIDYEMLSTSFDLIRAVRGQSDLTESADVSHKIENHIYYLMQRLASCIDIESDAVAPVILDAWTSFYELSDKTRKGRAIHFAAQYLKKTDAFEQVFIAMLTVEPDPTNRGAIYAAYAQNGGTHPDRCTAQLLTWFENAPTERDQTALISLLFSIDSTELNGTAARNFSLSPMLTGDAATRFVDEYIALSKFDGSLLSPQGGIRLAVAGLLLGDLFDGKRQNWFDAKLVELGADPLKLVAFAQGVGDCRRCTAQPGVENITRNRATVLFRSFVANFDVAGTDMGETRRALAFGMRELPPFDGGVNSSSWGFDLQYLIEDEDNADVREALMITYAQTGKHPYRVKESYLRGLWTAAKSPEEKARVANAMISIYTEDYIRDSKESSLRALRALRAFNVSPALRKHIKSVLDSNHHQPTARAGFPNGSTRYN